MESEDFDLIVIGGGPGGSTVGTLVAKQGHRVLLLEREHFPRYQVGESLIPATAHGMAELLGIREELKTQGYPVKYGTCFRWGKAKEPWCFDFGTLPALGAVDAGYAYQVERAKFDHLLLDNARKHGVDVREGHAVDDYLVEDGRVVGVHFTDGAGVKRTARARFVANAGGNTSALYDRIGERVFSQFFQNVALFTYYEGGYRMPPPRQGQFLAAAFDLGWFWYIPLSDTLTSVGAVVDKSEAGRLTDPLAAMNHFIDACPLIKDWLGGAKRITDGMYGQFRVRKDYSYTTTRFYHAGALLLGDAACFVDPVFSTGVHLATYSGLLSARSINTMLSDRGLPEETVFAEFELRYRLEYERIYSFLVAFYDMDQDQESYYWAARRVNTTEERHNDAFVSLVSGMSSHEFFDDCTTGNSKVLAEYIEADRRKSMFEAGVRLKYGERVPSSLSAQSAGQPVRERGLIPDGLCWKVPGAVAIPETSVDGLRWAWPPRRQP